MTEPLEELYARWTADARVRCVAAGCACRSPADRGVRRIALKRRRSRARAREVTPRGIHARSITFVHAHSHSQQAGCASRAARPAPEKRRIPPSCSRPLKTACESLLWEV